jgi:DNA end-binding protein Ku
VTDLLEALQASVDRARSHRAGNQKKEPRKLQTRKSGANQKKGADKTKGETEKKQKKADAATDLDNLSRQELYDLAQQLDVPGRSKMSRKDLASAVAKAQQRTKKAS